MCDALILHTIAVWFDRMSTGHVARIVIVLGVIAMGAVAYFVVQQTFSGNGGVASWGIGAFAVACFLSAFPIPTLFTLSCVAAGLVLGFKTGSAVALPSALCGMMAVFEISRQWWRDAATQSTNKYFIEMSAMATRFPRAGVVLVRVLPVPFSFQNMFWGGYSDVSRLDFFVCSAVVVVPHVCLMVYVGSTSISIADAVAKRPATSLPLVLVGVLAAALLYTLARHLRRTTEDEVRRQEVV
jgi:uncharacterized membrane protein YdjX (TVP38/TMEM64 family)